LCSRPPSRGPWGPVTLKCPGILAPASAPELVARRAGAKPSEVEATNTEIEDGEVVRRVLAGEDELFETIVRRYQVRVVSHVTRMVGSRDDALDLSQEIFLKVFQALDRFNPAYKFSTWLFRIAGNAAIDHLRKRRPRTVPLEVPDPEGGGTGFQPEQKSAGLDPYGELRNVERGRAITRAIQDLPADFRELIALRHFVGLSYEEIAEVKKMPLDTVKNKLFRARVVLKERLAGETT
jgi:RNA polymerase sigma-70 factor, ECF subfamily